MFLKITIFLAVAFFSIFFLSENYLKGKSLICLLQLIHNPAIVFIITIIIIIFVCGIFA